jgi:hypothetical protein
MKTRPNNKQTTETAPDTQNAAPVASIKLDNVTGGWWYGPSPYGAWAAPWAAPGPGPYANPYAAARYAGYAGYAPFDRRAAAWYAARAPGYGPWW